MFVLRVGRMTVSCKFQRALGSNIRKYLAPVKAAKSAGRHCVTGNKRNAAQQKDEERQVKRTRTVEAVNVEEEEEEVISSEEEIDLLTVTEDEEEGNEGE